MIFKFVTFRDAVTEMTEWIMLKDSRVFPWNILPTMPFLMYMYCMFDQNYVSVKNELTHKGKWVHLKGKQLCHYNFVSSPFWSALREIICCQRSKFVSLEDIRYKSTFKIRRSLVRALFSRETNRKSRKLFPFIKYGWKLFKCTYSP